ncbi:MAG: 2-dehydro-3-deoxygluconokinase [Cellvibrionales bacterium]|nr:MAG: 2-dehydro-3-deoxygluconokinase [Cellvibrionales bacterium]
MPESRSANVICFGEALWDVLPSMRSVGGAPLNVAYHLKKLGVRAWPMSGVGNDPLGEELKSQIEEWGLPSDLICSVADRETGRSLVTVLEGEPNFEVLKDVAWDYIDVPENWPVECQPAEALVFGSLAQRSARNRAVLDAMFVAMPNALKVLDVNLRDAFEDYEQIWALARSADLVKLNDEEMQALMQTTATRANAEDCARSFQREAGCETVCMTMGAQGAGLLRCDEWHWVDAVPVKVRDTVGAGDSFLAGLIYGLLITQEDATATLRRSATLASFVASSDGATPDYDIGEFVAQPG